MSGIFQTLNSALLNFLQSDNGAKMVGYNGKTVEQQFAAIDQSINDIKNTKADAAQKSEFAATKTKNTAILGDSISHGAFSINTFMHGWVRVFQRAFNAEVGGTSYGFVPLLSMGSTSDIHSVNFFGTPWVAQDSAGSVDAQNYPNGFAMRGADATSVISITVPFFQNRAIIYYGTQPAGGDFEVSVNSGAAVNVSTAGQAGYASTEFAMADGGAGNCTISIRSKSTLTNPVDIIGLSYLAAAIEPTLHNFSQSGRRLAYVSEYVISRLCQECDSVILALNFNDQGDADTNDGYFAGFQTRINWLIKYAKQYGTKIIVNDFCWTAPKNSRTRAELLRLATETGGIYTNFQALIFGDNITPTTDYLINTLGMWTDGAHPNAKGHKFIAESLMKRLSYGCKTKMQALSDFDYWMPFELKPGIENNFKNTSDLVSSYKRSGSQIAVKLFVKNNGANSFTAGTANICDGFRAKSEIGAKQGYQGPGVYRSDTGALTSVVTQSQSGQITLKVTDGNWLAYQQISYTVPA